MSTKETFRPTPIEQKPQAQVKSFVPDHSFLNWRNEQLKKLQKPQIEPKNLTSTIGVVTEKPKATFKPSTTAQVVTPEQEVTTRRNVIRIFGGLAAGAVLVGLGLNSQQQPVEATPNLDQKSPTETPIPTTEQVPTPTPVVENTPTPKVEIQGLSEAKPEIKLVNGIQYALPVQWDNPNYYTTLSQLFGENRQPGFYNPATGHSGIDMVAGPTPDNTNSGYANGFALAAVDGVARLKQDPTGFGNNVEVTSTFGGKTYIFRVAHLSEFDIKDGDVVKKGQRLGRVGTTGASTGNHLHFDIREESTGKYVDPFSPETFLGGMMNDKQRAVRIEELIKGSPLATPGMSEFIAGLGRKINPKTGKPYNIDPALVFAILVSETSLYTDPSLKGNNNPGNVGNTDSCPTCGTYSSIEAGIEGIFTTLDNNLLGGKKMVGELSNGGYTALGRPVQPPVYASSAENWNNNVTKTLAHFYGLDPKLQMSDDWIHKTLAKYNFRIYS